MSWLAQWRADRDALRALTGERYPLLMTVCDAAISLMVLGDVLLLAAIATGAGR